MSISLISSYSPVPTGSAAIPVPGWVVILAVVVVVLYAVKVITKTFLRTAFPIAALFLLWMMAGFPGAHGSNAEERLNDAEVRIEAFMKDGIAPVIKNVFVK